MHIIARDHDARAALGLKGGDEMLGQFAQHGLRRRRAPVDHARPHQIMRFAQRDHPRLQGPADLGQFGILPQAHGHQTPHHRKQVLDAVAQFARHDFQRFGRRHPVVNIRAGADPAQHAAIGVQHRQTPRQHPDIVAIMPPQPVFDLIGQAGFHRLAPCGLRGFDIIGMQELHPAGAIAGAGLGAGMFDPLAAEIVDHPVGRGGPDQLRQGIGQRTGNRGLTPWPVGASGADGKVTSGADMSTGVTEEGAR
ncbi:hypothetical protein E4T56_gene14379 [Termitomyces sp. T112]|nr:hypothetical protein E4T56_gene14379 [Termitomyces sp. T112]